MTTGKRLTAQVRIQQSPAHVFNLLSDADGLKQWFAEAASVDLDRGEYNFWGEFTPETPGKDSGHVMLIGYTAPLALSFSWRLRGAETRVEYRLEADGNGTMLTVEHSGLPARAEPQGAMHDFWYIALENLRLAALTGEQQQLCSYLPKRGSSFSLSVDIRGTATEAFSKITDPAEIDRYYGNGAQVDLRVGGKFDYGWQGGLGPIKILELQPARKLIYSWKYDEPYETVVNWTLADSGGRTRLTITHSGFTEEFDSEGYRTGWFSFLAIIKGMVELGDRWSMVEISGIEHGDA